MIRGVGPWQIKSGQSFLTTLASGFENTIRKVCVRNTDLCFESSLRPLWERSKKILYGNNRSTHFLRSRVLSPVNKDVRPVTVLIETLSKVTFFSFHQKFRADDIDFSFLEALLRRHLSKTDNSERELQMRDLALNWKFAKRDFWKVQIDSE